MRRVPRAGIFAFAVLVSVLCAVSGCGQDGMPGPDAACSSPVDLDWAPPDLAHGPGTGDPCKRDSDCVPGPDGRARCILKTAPGEHWVMEVVWPGGYCSSYCRIERNDPDTGINPDCPGGSGSCEQLRGDGGAEGQCLLQCFTERYRRYCDFERFQYRCGSPGRRPLCLPATVEKRECDGRKRGSCGPGRTCVVDVDDVFQIDTQCERACDPILPPADCNCQRTEIGEGFCLPPVDYFKPYKPGERCFGGNGPYPCTSGYGCTFDTRLPSPLHCRRYCTRDGDRSQCGPCGACVDIVNGIGLCTL